jgi:hypothetical protein
MLCEVTVAERGMTHEVVVAVTSVITSRGSEGPLGFRGHGLDEWMSLFPERGMKSASLEPIESSQSWRSLQQTAREGWR